MLKTEIITWTYCYLMVTVVYAQKTEPFKVESCYKMDSCSLVCYNTTTIPRKVPEDIKRVTLRGIDLGKCRMGAFSNESWLNVLELYLYAEFGLFLFPGVFIGLDNLTSLTIRGLQLRALYKTSFRGLQSLRNLDLSDNTVLHIDYIFDVLQDNTKLTLPHLKWLDLSRVHTIYIDPIPITRETFEILSKRRIEFLNFTGCIIGPFDIRYISPVCNHLKHLILNGVTLSEPKMFGSYLRECPSLKIVDIRNLNSVDVMNMINFFKFNFYPDLYVNTFLKPILSVEKLLMSNVFRNKLVINLKLNFTSYAFSLTHVDLSFNNMRVFNGSVMLNPETRKSIKNLDFSHNSMEYISPLVLGASLNTERVNLAHNSLKSMVEDHLGDFTDLFINLTKLRFIDISANGFEYLPTYTFLQNILLQEIVISGNSLTTLDWKLDHLANLKFLDLSNNDIKSLSPTSILQLKQIWVVPNVSKATEDKRLDVEILHRPVLQVHNNPLVCNCDTEIIEALTWIVLSGFVDKTTTLTCTLNKENIQIFPSALTKTKEYCHSIKVRLYLFVGGGIALVVILILFLAIVLVRRRVWKRNAVKNFLRKINKGEKLKYLVFLSFCSEDGDTVLEDILPKMQKEASKALNCDRNLICCGELDFKPGQSVCLEVMRCMEESAVVIFAISDTFCQKDWCKMEIKEARDQRKPVILLFLEKVDPERMTPYIQKLFRRYTRASWIRDENDGHPHPTWPALISSVIELGATFEAENSVETNDNDSVVSAEFVNGIEINMEGYGEARL